MICIENFVVKVYFRLKIIKTRNENDAIVYFKKSYNYYNFQIVKRVNINEDKQRIIFNIISEMRKKYIQHSCEHRQLYGC